ncbi:MAG: YciI family protein [Terrimicrobiaceae bacterium]|nr:YciI family protein [Terrimicrobiaceae bacterium]
MTTQTNTSEYMLLFRGTRWEEGLSPEETEKVLNRFFAWFENLKAKGKLKAGQPLMREGRIVSSSNGRTIVDGPFAESKEAIGGYFLLTVAGMEEAVAIARQCPILEFGSSVEVRPVAEECPTMRDNREAVAELAHAAA